ncbi:MAG: hypothetical protein KGI79_00735 [Patescibacteria group bacterium]|nr:hypothetical protein [Patescibacteria group bacterium]MDE2116388.1 hypothetical protein [Patescibacteria group bacterium]
MRLALNIALAVSLLFLPWWTGAIVALSACFLVPNFYEVIVYGILVDALYASRFGEGGWAHIATIYAVAVFLIGSSVRTRLAW